MFFEPGTKREAETEADPLSLAAFIAWLERQRTAATYDFMFFERCAVAQWVASLGGAPDMEDNNSMAYLVNNRPVNLDRFRGVVAERPWTFGAALERARKLARNN